MSTASSDQNAPDQAPLLSVVVPVLNEEDNLRSLIGEIHQACTGACSFEIIYVDDASTDKTPALLTEMMAELPELRALQHSKRCGQSAGTRTGVMAAKGTLIATLDGDGQNDPADIPKLLETYRANKVDGQPLMVTGHRVNRKDTWSKRRASRLANWLRRSLLNDDNPDTGCALKLFERDLFLAFPYFDHMHRFLPALAKREGSAVEVVPVNHRARQHGVSKYKILDRVFVGVPDLIGVMWLLRRSPKGLQRKEL